MQQKIQFIATLLHDPGLVVMDEPFSGLDPVNTTLLQDALLDLKSQGKAILFSTHRMDQVEKLCDSICLINNGEAVLSGNLREIKSRYERNHVIVEFEGSADFLKSDEIASAPTTTRAMRKSPSSPTATRKSCFTSPHPWPPFIVSSSSSLHSRKSLSRPWEAKPMRNMLLVARREYLEQIRGRAFRISTILVPALILFLLGVSGFTGRKLASGRHIAIAADNASLAADIRADLLADKGAHYTVDTVAPFTAQDRADLQARIENKSLDGLVIIENSASATPSVTYESQSSADLLDTSRLTEAINAGFLNLRLAQQGISSFQVHSLVQSVPLETLQVSSSGKTGKSQGMTPFYAAMLMTFLMTMPILLYGMDMARSVIEEKSSRIFEVMLAVATP